MELEIDDCGIVRIKQSMMIRHGCFEGRRNDSSDPSMIRASKSKERRRRCKDMSDGDTQAALLEVEWRGNVNDKIM